DAFRLAAETDRAMSMRGFLSGEKSWDYHSDKIDQEMGNHVGQQITPPLIENGQNRTGQERGDDVRPAAGPMSEGENQDWNCCCPKPAETERLETFNCIAAIK